MGNIDFNKIKLIIWDLDDTFWRGTISEGDIKTIKENVCLVKNLTDHGIINSICSKNDKVSITEKLKKMEIEDYFVFNSINWEPKGRRIKQIIEDMGLRPVNVLFIDDNIQNLQEAKFYSPDLMTVGPDIIPDIINWVKSSGNLKDDNNHSRLKQYKVLEQKGAEQSNYSYNE